MGFTKPKKAIGLDIGTYSVKVVQMSRAGGRLRVDRAAQTLIDRNQLNVDPVGAQVVAVREAMSNTSGAQSQVVAALAGQTVVVRYPRLTDVPRESLKLAVGRETANTIPFDLSDVMMDWVVLDEYQEEDRRQTKVLIVAAKNDVVDTRLQILQGAEVPCGVLGVDSLALADAAEACDFLRRGETVAIINIGLTSSCVHFFKDGISNFIREVNWGARELVQAIAKGRRCSYEEAVEALESYTQETGDVPEAMEAVDAELDLPQAQEPPPFPAGAGVSGSDLPSLLDPLEEETEVVGAEEFSRGAEPTFFSSVDARAHARFEDLTSGALTRMGVELRRSFDYYEHQLYEQPVDRILLSGGPAHLSLIAHALKEELGFNTVEIANPAASALAFGSDSAVAPLMRHPAQFVVAIGLAARGMADL